MKKQTIDFLATGFYSGKISFMPGTWGTVVAIPLTWALAYATRSLPLAYMLITIAAVLIASFISELHERFTEAHDPSEIVIDEIVGYMIAMVWLPNTWQAYVGAFIAFRFFDILKPWPISYIDQNIEGGLGTVLDDVAAGLVSNILLQVIFVNTTWLGVQYHGG